MESIQKYRDLINDSLFEEAYMMLEKDVQELVVSGDVISKNKLIRDFFVDMFDIDYFSELIDRGVMLPIAQETVRALFEKDFLRDQIKKFPNYVDQDKIGIMFIFLAQNHDFKEATYLLPLVNKNITSYPESMKKMIASKNYKALEFFLNNMDNIHYNEGALLRACSGMSTDTLRLMIDELKFDINEQSKTDGMNLMHTLLTEKNVKNFSFVVQHYGDKIDWSCKATAQKKQFISVLDLVEASGSYSEFYNIILDDLSLKENIVDRIGSVLLTNTKAMEQCSNSDVYEKLFSHPNFSPKVTNLQQIHLVYGLLSCIGNNSGSRNFDLAKQYYGILNTFLHTYVSHEDTVEESAQYNVVGAAIKIVEKLEDHFKNDNQDLTGTKISLDAATLIIQRYKSYINKPNPDGRLSIELTSKDSNAYRLLVNNGALTAEPETGVFNALARMMGGKKRELDRRREEIINQSRQTTNEVEMSSISSQMGNTSLAQLKNQMREDFRTMRSYLENKLCDSSIKFKCENMFLKSERLVKLMEKYNVTKSFEDMIFLNKNFSEYLKDSLKAYIQVCEATTDFSESAGKYEKLDDARKKCLEHVDLLSNQVELIAQNISDEAEGNAIRNQNIQGRFLKKRFVGTESSLGFDKIVSENIISHEKSKNRNSNMDSDGSLSLTKENTQKNNSDFSENLGNKVGYESSSQEGGQKEKKDDMIEFDPWSHDTKNNEQQESVSSNVVDVTSSLRKKKI